MSVKSALWILTAINMVNFMDRYVMATVVEAVKKDMGISDFQAGTLMSGFMAGYMIMSPIFSVMDRKTNRSKLMAAGVLIWSIATFASGLMQSFLGLLLMRLLVGVGEASYGTIAPAYLRDAAADEKQANWFFAVFYVAVPVGSALGFIFGGAITQYFSWHMAFFFAAIPGIFLGLASFRLPNQIGEASATDGQEHKVELLPAVKTLLSSWRFRGVIGGYTLYTFAMGGFAAWVPSYGTHVLGATETEIGLGFGLVTMTAATIGTLFGGKIANLFVSRDLAVEGFSLFCGICTLISVPFAFLAFQTDSLVLFLMHMFIVELFMFGATAPVNTATLEAAPPALAATAMAVSIFSIHMFGDLISPPIIGIISDFADKQTAMQILPVAAAIGAVWWIQICRRGYAENPASRETYPISPLTQGFAGMIQYLFRRIAKIFYREVAVLRSNGRLSDALIVKDPELKPEEPTLLIANHPNAILDAVVVYCTAKHPLRSVAKSTLWNIPILRPLLAVAGAVPVFRKQDEGESRNPGVDKFANNDQAIQEVARALCRHSFIIYPEGRSHDEPMMSKFKTGGARMLLYAAHMVAKQQEKRHEIPKGVAIEQGPLVVFHIEDAANFGFQPVALFFDDKTKFRSRVLVHYGNRISLRDILNEAELARIKDHPFDEGNVRKVTDAMESNLRRIVPESSSEDRLSVIRNLASLLADPFGQGDVHEMYRWEVAVRRILEGDSNIPDGVVQDVKLMLDSYFRKVKDARMTDILVRDHANNPKTFWQRTVIRTVWFLIWSVILSPFIALGYLGYHWAYRVTGKLASKLAPDLTELGTYKFLGGAILMGLSALAYAIAIFSYMAGRGKLAEAGLAAILIPILSGFAILLFSEQFKERLQDLRLLISKAKRGDLVRLSELRNRTVERLLALYDKFVVKS